MADVDIEVKRRFWRRVLIAGILLLVVTACVVFVMYSRGMAEFSSVGGSELEREIAMVSGRRELLLRIAKWLLPVAILSSLMMNVARFRLRRLKKLENQ